MISYVLSSLVRGWMVASGDRSTSSTVAEATTTVALACAAWLAIRGVAPGRTTFQNASAIGFLSSQVLTAWSSLALWAGVGAVLGHVAHGGGCAWGGSLALTRNVRSAQVATYLSVVVVEWLLGVVNPGAPYGLVHGPETALFVAVLAGVLAVGLACNAETVAAPEPQ